jgi:hypothetical protein
LCFFKNNDKIEYIKSNKMIFLTQNPPQLSAKPFWQQPTTIVTKILGLALVAYPIFQDSKTPRIKSVPYRDVFLSDQAFTKEIQNICHQRLEKLIEGDIRIDGKFADRPMVLNNQEYQGKERLNLQNACQNILLPLPGLGKQKGTNLMLALESLDLELQKQRTLDNNEKAVIIIAINAAETAPIKHQSNSKPSKLKSKNSPNLTTFSYLLAPKLNGKTNLKPSLTMSKIRMFAPIRISNPSSIRALTKIINNLYLYWRSRLDTWRQTKTPLINQLPQNYREYILATMDKDGREQLKNDRLAEFQSICSRCLSPDKENLTTFIGALTFSVAPQLIASQAGRSPLAMSAGLVGGAAASFFAHSNAIRTLKMKLKNSTKQIRKTIIQKQSQVQTPINISHQPGKSPETVYYEAQLNRLNDVENKHNNFPSKPALVFAGGLSVVEAGIAFYLLIPAGALIATIGAFFPVFLLWAMANYQADRVELPKQCQELMEIYNDSISYFKAWG